MAADVVNLRMARKRKQRAEREAQAEKNRFEHGRSKADREAARLENERGRRAHDAGRLISSPEDTSGKEPD